MDESFWQIEKDLQKKDNKQISFQKPTQLIAVLHKLRNYRY